MIQRLIVLSIIVGAAGRAAASDYYSIQVVDAETGRGVPLVELSPNGGTVVVTDSNGRVAFDQPALMNQNVFFGLRSYGYTDFGQTLHPTGGGIVQIALDRQNLAERLYRVTGTGIYQDSVALGESVPISKPLLNANVKGQDSVQTAIYKNQIHWFWGDTVYEAGNLFPNFRSSGARSPLPGSGGLDPALGVNLNYFVNSDGNAKQMMPIAETGLVWLDGVFTVPDNSGQERMLTRYERHLDLETIVEQGLALFNDSTETFQRFQSYSLTAPITPQGHTFRHTTGGQEYVYFDLTYPNVRVQADWEHVTSISTWEAFTPLRENTRYNAANPPLDLDAKGNVVYGWKKNTDPLSYEMLHELVQNGHVEREELPFRLKDAKTGEAVRMHRSSVHWNAYRQAWVMIGVESFGDSFLGEVWFAESPTPEGPWDKAVKVATHNRGSNGDYSFYNPTSHPFFDQEGGRILYFEGTYSNTFSNNPNQTPLYDYNQMMYGLDLARIPNLFPRLTGDYNRDNVVDAADFVVWRDTMGSAAYLAADGSGNGTIDAADLELWRANFGASGSAAQAIMVPEPELGQLALILLCLLLLLSRLRQGLPA